MPQEEDRIRSIAGYLLKNNARLILRSAPDVIEYVKKAVLRAFDDSSIMVRNVAGQAIVALLGTLEPRNWPECLSHLVGALDDPDFDKQEVSDSFFPHCAPSLGGCGGVLPSLLVCRGHHPSDDGRERMRDRGLATPHPWQLAVSLAGLQYLSAALRCM